MIRKQTLFHIILLLMALLPPPHVIRVDGISDQLGVLTSTGSGSNLMAISGPVWSGPVLCEYLYTTIHKIFG